MSNTVIAKGKLTPTGQTLREFMGSNGYGQTDEEELMQEFDEDFYRKAILLDKKVFLIEGTVKEFEASIFDARLNNDGTIEYLCVYYNGGCCLDEAIKYAVEKNINNPS